MNKAYFILSPEAYSKTNTWLQKEGQMLHFMKTVLNALCTSLTIDYMHVNSYECVGGSARARKERTARGLNISFVIPPHQ